MAREQPMEGPHWSFALAIYGKPGVADACLRLQDTLGVDVNVLLFALYAASERSFALDAHSLPALDRAVAPFRDEVVVKLRAIRRRLKEGPSPAPNPETEAIRDMVKKAELRAEQIEQAALAQWLDERAPSKAPDPVDARQVLAAVVGFYAGRCSGENEAEMGSESRAAVDAILKGFTAMRANP